jgi:hypothetical protein
MPLTPSLKPLRIVPQSSAQPTLSKAQQAFNTLVKKIEIRRHELAQWQATVDQYQQKLASSYRPLMTRFNQQKTAFVLALDQALGHMEQRKGLTRTERAAVEDIICNLAEQLLSGSETQDDAVKEIYNRYHEVDFDAQEAQAVSAFKAGLERDLGVELDDWPEDATPAEVLAQLRAKMTGLEDEQRPPPKKKTAKQLAREANQKAEEDQTSLSIREVYRKLASALHPDREPDEAERERKTGLMQRVNLAYAKKDLLKLLELQLELEHIDEHTIAGLSEDRLKHYSKVLKEQVKELEQEIAQLEHPLKAQFHVHPYQTLSYKSVMPLLMRDMADLQRHINQIKQDMRVLGDPPAFKVWIKAYKRELKAHQEARDEFDFF